MPHVTEPTRWHSPTGAFLIMKLNCALLFLEDDASRAVTAVDVPDNAPVADLLKAIHAVLPHPSRSITTTTITLHLYLAAPTTHTTTLTTQGHVWLQRDKLALLDASFVQRHCVRLDDLTRRCDELFGLKSDPSEGDTNVHVVVVSDMARSKTEEDDDDDNTYGRCWKRARRGKCPITQPGVILGEYCVPLDAIQAFNDIQVALTLRESKPMVLYCGSRLSGKTTIAKGIRRWINEAIGDQESRQIPHLHEVLLDNDVAMWKELGRRIHGDKTCTDKASFVRVSAARPSLWFLVLDSFHLLLEKPQCASQFLDALRELRGLSHFGGFLGIGDCTLESLPQTSDGLFHADAVVQSMTFTDDQMRVLLKQLDLFTDSLQRGLMSYSGGYPGILGSLITFTESQDQCYLEFDEWKHWFETRGFAEYVQFNRMMFPSLCDEWLELTQRDWSDLSDALKKRKPASDRVPLYLRPVSGDHDHDEAEMRLNALASVTTAATSSSEDADPHPESRPAVDGYTRMCERIRGWYLRIIVKCRQQAREDDARYTLSYDASGCIRIIHRVDDEAIAEGALPSP